METLYKCQPADVWEITKTGAQPDWVKDAFSQNYLYWLDNRVRILMWALTPPNKKNLKFVASGSLGGGVDALGVYAYGDSGDFLDATNQRVVSRERFFKQYQILKSNEA